MLFSKSFGYAVRSVLYIAHVQKTKPFVQAEEMAKDLAVPRHFLGKILIKLVKAGVLVSLKGKSGGFAATEETGKVSLLQLFLLTDGEESFSRCSLRLQKCHSNNPCPLHNQVSAVREQMRQMLSSTSIAELLTPDKTEFLKSISTAA